MNTKQILGLVFTLLGLGYFLYGLMYKNFLLLPLIIGIVGVVLVMMGSKGKK